MSAQRSAQEDGERLTGDSGASLVEYALLLALIAAVSISALTYFGNVTSSSLSKSASRIGAAGQPAPGGPGATTTTAAPTTTTTAAPTTTTTRPRGGGDQQN